VLVEYPSDIRELNFLFTLAVLTGHQQNEVDPDVDYDNFSRHLNEHGDELREVYQYMNQHYPGSRRQQFTRPTFPSDPQNPTSGS